MFLTIQGRRIGVSYPPYIVAELSANHNRNISTALTLIEKAKESGADAVKLQSYTPEIITINSRKPDFLIKGGLWNGKYLYDLYKSAYTPKAWHLPLFEKAKELNITIFSSPFDYDSVDMLEQLNAPAYKISSFELIDLPLINYIANTGKPIIMSTGMASKIEIYEAIDTAINAGCTELVILHCISEYPALASNYNLKTIAHMAKCYGKVVGLSDHTIGNTTAIASIALGAAIIEKHFTLNRNNSGVDNQFSLEPLELVRLVHESKIAWEALGKIHYGPTKNEEKNLQFRRSLYAINNIKKGEPFTKFNVRSIRPGYGLEPKYFNSIINIKSPYNLEIGDPIPKNLLSYK